jgi:hypothetical protein
MIQFYQTSNFKLLIFLFECSNQLFRILITLFFQFPDIPLGYRFYNRLEGIDIQILIRDDLDAILGLPSGEDLDIDSFKAIVEPVTEWYIGELKKQGYKDAEELVAAFK